MTKQDISDILSRYHELKSLFRYSSTCPTEYLLVLGEISVNFAALERAVIYSLTLLSGTYGFDKVLCLVGGDFFNTNVQKLQKLFRTVIRDETLRAEFSGIRVRLLGLSRLRNTFVHSEWIGNNISVGDKAPPIPERYKFRRDMDKNDRLIDQEPVELKVLLKLAEDISVAYEDIMCFMLEIHIQLEKDKKTSETPPNSN